MKAEEISRLRKFIRAGMELLKHADPEGEYVGLLSDMIRDWADIKKEISNIRGQLKARFGLLSENTLMIKKKSLCDYLVAGILRLNKPSKIFMTKDLVEIAKKSGYHGTSFSKDPVRTVYNCVLHDPQKRFYRPPQFRKGFALNREIVMKLKESEKNF